MKDYIIRNCGKIGFLGILEIDGVETYRTGMHHAAAVEALLKVQLWDANHQ